MSIRRILLVFDECGPGDALRASFGLSSVRTAYPEAEIVVLAGQQAAEIFEHSTIADRVVISRLYVPTHRRALRARIDKLREGARLIRELGFRYDMAVTFWWGSLTLNMLTFVLARRRIGYTNRLGFLQSSRLGSYKPLGDGTAQNLSLLAAAGVRSAEPALYQLRRNETDVAAVHQVLRRHGLNGAKPFVVLHSGSDWACQQWSVGSWARLGDRVIEQYGVDVALTGSASERPYVDEIRRVMRHPAVSVCGETPTLNQLSGLLSMASLCISVDSAPYELARAEGVPVIVLSGPTMPGTQPIGSGRVTVINNTGPELRRAIVRCQAGFAHGRCHDYSCPMSQLRDIRVESVLARIADTGALSRVTAAQAASE